MKVMMVKVMMVMMTKMVKMVLKGQQKTPKPIPHNASPPSISDPMAPLPLTTKTARMGMKMGAKWVGKVEFREVEDQQWQNHPNQAQNLPNQPQTHLKTTLPMKMKTKPHPSPISTQWSTMPPLIPCCRVKWGRWRRGWGS